MNLVIDIGNTQTKLAWFDQGRIIDQMRTDNDSPQKIYDLIGSHPFQNAILSSVNQMDEEISHFILKKGIQPMLLSHHTRLPFQINYKTPETLGRDRIAAAAGARYVCPFCHVLVIDMGTAITYEFVTAEGIYLGGNISPGMNTRFKALHEFTAKLPLVERDQDFPDFGTDTQTAIAAGVQQGIIYEINSYIDEYAKRYPACEFILTGGDAGFFVSKLKRSIFAIPDLVLKGLNYILEFNIKS